MLTATKRCHSVEATTRSAEPARARRGALGLALLAFLAMPITDSRVAFTEVASFTNASGIVVPDSGAGAPYPSAIVVSAVKSQIIKLTVALVGLTHARLEDLDILLVGSGGQTVLLLSDCCGAAPVSGVTLTFDDFGKRLTRGASVVSARVKPVNFDVTTDAFPAPAPPGPYGSRLSVFNGTDPNGAWRLFVHDDQPMHAGRIAAGWSLRIQADLRAGHPMTPAGVAPLLGAHAVTLRRPGASQRFAVPILLRPTLASGAPAAIGADRP